MKRCRESGPVFAVNEDGALLQDVVMLAMLGVDKLPTGFRVGFIDGNTLNCRHSNLVLVPE